jgi:hypothetical protein
VKRPSKRQKIEHGAKKALEDGYAKNPDPQCASYALELLSHGRLRTHTVGLLVSEDQITLKYYEHSIIVDARTFSFQKEPMRLVAMLYAMSRLTYEQWGFDPVLGDPIQLTRPKTKSSMPTDNYRRSTTFKGAEMRWSSKVTLTLEEEITNQRSLIGCGTRVVSACGEPQCNRKRKDDDAKGLMQSQESGSASNVERSDEVQNRDRVAVKFGYVPASRESEVEIVKGLRDLAVKYLEDQVMLDHLPPILDAQDHPAREVQQRLKRYFDDCDKRRRITLSPTYEERLLRITIQEPLKPVRLLRDGNRESERPLAKIFHDVFKCTLFVSR